MSLDKFEQLRRVVPDVSRETFERLLAYEQLFMKWSKSFNLASPATLHEFWSRHVLDSAQLFTIKEPKGTWLDIGSGGGLPGVVIAIMMASQTNAHVHLIESNGKKAAFLRTALLETGAAGTVHLSRIEDAPKLISAVDIVTARAVSSLGNLFELTSPWLLKGATALFHKGQDFQREIDETRGAWRADLVKHVSVIDPASAIVEVKSLARQVAAE
jgi:16S rRNA (guanine527-N7)-methyltransferase